MANQQKIRRKYAKAIISNEQGEETQLDFVALLFHRCRARLSFRAHAQFSETNSPSETFGQTAALKLPVFSEQ